jgi:cytochrome c556
MMPMLVKKLISTRTLLLGSLLLMHLPVSAQQDVIDARQSGFKDMGAAMKTLRDELKSGKPDHTSIAAAAEQLSTLANKVPDWFPAGSGVASGLKTDARDYIWENKEKFDAITKELIVESKALVPLAKSADTAALQKKLGVIRDNCSSCHDSFRVD